MYLFCIVLVPCTIDLSTFVVVDKSNKQNIPCMHAASRKWKHCINHIYPSKDYFRSKLRGFSFCFHNSALCRHPWKEWAIPTRCSSPSIGTSMDGGQSQTALIKTWSVLSITLLLFHFNHFMEKTLELCQRYMSIQCTCTAVFSTQVSVVVLHLLFFPHTESFTIFSLHIWRHVWCRTCHP